MENISEFFNQLLPIVGAVVLLVLAVVLYQVIRLLAELVITVKKVNVTVDDVNNKLVALDAPVQTVKNISTSVDNGFKAGGHAVSNVVGKTKGAVQGVRSAVSSVFKKEKE